MSIKKNKIEVRLMRGNMNSGNTIPDYGMHEKLVAEGNLVEELESPAILISRLDFPVIIQYGKRKIRLSPRAKEMIADAKKLTHIPQGVYVKKLSPSVKSKKVKK